MMPSCLDLTPIADPRGLTRHPITMVIYGLVLCLVLLWLVRRWRAKRDGR